MWAVIFIACPVLLILLFAFIYMLGYFAGRVEQRKFDQPAVDALKLIVLFCEDNGKPCDGPRFREGVLKGNRALDKMA